MKRTLIIILCFFFIFSILYAEEIPAPEEKPVMLEQLYELIEAADSLIVKESPFGDAEVLFESRDKKDLVALRESLVIGKPKEWFHCMCIGTPAIYLYKGDEELVLLTSHHGISVRCSLWDSDVPVIDVEKWLAWFDERKITGPRKEVEEMRIQQEKSKKNWERWREAMPQPIKSLWSDALGAYDDVNIVPLSTALEIEIPGQDQRILALLEWFGSGAGPWSGFPSYESAAEEMLLGYETKDIVAASNLTRLTQSQLEGAARFFGGWSFSHKRPDGLQGVPDTLKAILWSHIKSTQNKDKLGRAKRAFRD